MVVKILLDIQEHFKNQKSIEILANLNLPIRIFFPWPVWPNILGFTQQLLNIYCAPGTEMDADKECARQSLWSSTFHRGDIWCQVVAVPSPQTWGILNGYCIYTPLWDVCVLGVVVRRDLAGFQFAVSLLNAGLKPCASKPSWKMLSWPYFVLLATFNRAKLVSYENLIVH